MPLSEESQKLLDAFNATGFKGYDQGTPEEGRAFINKSYEALQPQKLLPIAEQKDFHVTTAGADAPVRVYKPSTEGKHPALVYFHGGGFVVRDNPDMFDELCRTLANGLNCVVISVIYRLAPEHPFPAAFNDCYGATQWAADNADELNIDIDRLGICGESAGGNLAAAVALKARDEREFKLSAQVIWYPCVDYNFETPSYLEYAKDHYLTRADMIWFWDHYLGTEPSNKNNPYALPMRAHDFSNLPYTIVKSAECDPLRDDGVFYAQKLQDAGNNVDSEVLPGMLHGFAIGHSSTQRGEQALQDVISKLNKHWA